MIYRSWVFLFFAAQLHAGSFDRGLAAKQNGDLAAAIKELSVAVDEEPTNVLAWYHYATVLGWEKRYDESLVAYDKGLALAPADHDLRLGKARLLAWQEKYDASLQILDSLAKDHPESLTVHIAHGQVAAWSQNDQKSRDAYQAALAIDDKQWDALMGLGDLARDSKETDGARSYYLKAREVDPKPEIDERLQLVDDMEQWWFDAGIRFSTFGGSSRSDWVGGWSQISRIEPGQAWWLRVAQEERFDLQDTLLDAGYSRNWDQGYTLSGYAGISPNADWAEQWLLGGGARINLDDSGKTQWVSDVKYGKYVPRGVWLARNGLDQSLGEVGVLSARWIYVDAEGSDGLNGFSVELRKELSESFWTRAGYASGAESLTSNSLSLQSTLRSRNYFVGVGGDITESLSWRLDLERELVENSVDRDGVSFSLQRRF